jgi:DNA polymerase elongation subunit (family B)
MIAMISQRRIMFKNCYYDTKRSIIHLWEQFDGENLKTEIEWTPYLFVPTTEGEEDARTIFGNPVKKKTFQKYYDYKKYLDDHKNPTLSENNVRNEIQFLAERYYGIPDDEMYVPTLKVYYLDIEARPKEGFPDVNNPQDPITLISIKDSITGTTYTFGYDNVHNKYYGGHTADDYEIPKDVKYFRCQDEKTLLRRFFNFMNKFPCDVLSGWNIWWFDLPYLINRAIVLFGADEGRYLYSRMSTINRVSIWKPKSYSENINIDIAGMTILDYYDVYKWYGKNLERYTLEYVSQTELGKGKLPNPYDNLNDLADKEWSRFVDYNIIDCERVYDLEDRLGYIKMIQALSLLCKSPMRNYNAQTQLIEGLMITYYRRNRLCAPYFAGGEQAPFAAAHVKEPQKGMHEWVVDIDITSSYPSHIIALNMSVETFFGRISRMEEAAVVDYTRKRSFPSFSMVREKEGKWEIETFDGIKLAKFNAALKKGLLAIAPCGSVFTTNKPGVVAKVEKAVFFKRKEVKGKKSSWHDKAQECELEADKKDCLEKKMQAHSLQLALKIMMNAFFGILSVPYSRYFNTHIAEAITSCGRHTIKSGQTFCNDLLNDPTDELLSMFPKKDIEKYDHRNDYVAYIDTDSLFVKLGAWIEDQGHGEEWKKMSDDEKIELIQDIARSMEKYIDNRIFNETQLLDYNSQVHDFKIAFKQEIIAKTALFVKKKKYAYWLLNDEGKPTNKIKVTGLEIVRSESAEAIRPRLTHIMEMIMKQEDDEKIASQIRKYKKELRELDPEALAANIGINNIRKYLGSGQPLKGTPWHVKGVHSYRMLLKELDIVNKYEDVHEGVKAKVIYAKKNPYNIKTITFNEWPKEFDSIIQYDPDTMIDKFFVKKIRLLLEPIRKEAIIDRDESAFKAFF